MRFFELNLSALVERLSILDHSQLNSDQLGQLSPHLAGLNSTLLRGRTTQGEGAEREGTFMAFYGSF